MSVIILLCSVWDPLAHDLQYCTKPYKYEKDRKRSWLKLTAFALLFSLNVLSIAQDNGFDISYFRQQHSISKISFQKIEFKTETKILPAYDRNLKTSVINLSDTLPKQSNVPLLRNENAGIWKKVGRAELFIGGAELFGITVLMLSPKEVTGWSPDWTQDAGAMSNGHFQPHQFGTTMTGN